MRRLLQFNLRQKLYLIMLLPILGLIGTGGILLHGLLDRYRRLDRDIATLQTYHAQLKDFEQLIWVLKSEREITLLPLAEETAPAREARLRAAFAETDRAKVGTLARIAEIIPLTKDEALLTRRKGLQTLFTDDLGALREKMLKGSAKPEEVIRFYIKLLFGALAVPEASRDELRSTESLNYYDAVMAEVKAQLQDMIGTSIVRYGLNAGRLPSSLLATMRKQTFAMTESEYYIRKFVPALRESHDKIMRGDELGGGFYNYLSDLAGNQMPDVALAAFKLGNDRIGPHLEDRHQRYLGLIAEGISLGGAQLNLMAREVRSQCLRLAGLIGIVLIASVATAFFAVRAANRRLLEVTTAIDRAVQATRDVTARLTEKGGHVSNDAVLLVTSSERISLTMHKVATGSREAEKQVNDTAQSAAATQANIESGVSAVASLNTTVQSITASGSQIQGVVAHINKISFMTNLLALNAAVEAARAGEAGAGFAVVADEVRRLAQDCAKAAEETARLATSSMRETKEATVRAKEVHQNFEKISAEAARVQSNAAVISQTIHRQNVDLGEFDQVVKSQEQLSQRAVATAEEVGEMVQALDRGILDLAATSGILSTMLGVTGAETDDPGLSASDSEPAMGQGDAPLRSKTFPATVAKLAESDSVELWS